MPKDYYAILGVKKDANEDEIKKSFRRLAHEHHPDKGGDQQKFKDINEAYQILGDTSKRAKYDQFGSAAFEQGGFGNAQGFSGFQGFDGMNINMGDFADLGDMFGDLFGVGRGRGRGTRRGSDIETEITLDFLEAAKGVTRRIKLYKHDPCSVCKGSGAEPGSKVETCKTCNGQGVVMQSARTIFGNIQTKTTCPECSGKGSKATTDCKQCKGLGVERHMREMDIAIPSGIDDGEAVKIVGEGEFPGAGGVSGDLFIRVQVKSHPLFSRNGADVRSTVRVPYSTLVLGGDIETETIDGATKMTISEGTEPGTVIRLRQKGIAMGRSGARGDHVVTIQPQVVRKPSKEQRKALEDLRQNGL